MKLGANSVLFGGYDLETSFKYLAAAGYDGIELSAIDGMSEHLVPAKWRELAPTIKRLSAEYGLELLAMEQPSQDPARMETASNSLRMARARSRSLCITRDSKIGPRRGKGSPRLATCRQRPATLVE